MISKIATTTALRAGARTFTTRATSGARTPSRFPLAFGAAAAVGAASLYMLPSVQLEGTPTMAGELSTTSERSFIMIKPDGVSRQLVGKIIDRFESRGYKLVAIKSVVPSADLTRQHYADLANKPFFGELLKYLTCGTPVIAMVWEGKDVIRQGRNMVGATNPAAALPGTIRGDYAVTIGRNMIHASDSFESATKEIGLWFNKQELAQYMSSGWAMTMEDN
ncbi:nucleoside-diphosphate kinase [Malassezia vespertilionis]|uniref:Nucleoside diphosphate kinase n=1 Tax=Malassezia vespertilionis TaxID=2020962 RepID=A0A2N1JEZ0_9BASI|nr:nucleoside-diphosphate kinase [Malassezia vespertilionis]PKI85121.1 hypothetical protein MVES_000986 [Malassezia vespertilionis]WFD05713.1 nucleoside-diphosphate kinase [Malassezia vespertilionis]